MVRQHLRFFSLFTLAALALRLFLVWRFPAVTSDSYVYGDIAKNWLQHGIYGLSGINDISPTAIRLPGYPAFLAAVFAIFGMEHYRTAILLQVFVDVATCFLIADLARRLLSDRAAKAAFALAAFCPFLANYSAAALTETWEIFFTVVALDFAVIGLDSDRLRPWVGCGLAIAAAILLRPDGGLLLASLELYLLVVFLRRNRRTPPTASLGRWLRTSAILAMASLAPLVPWTLRNLYTLHEFQPLAPRYSEESGEFVPMGFNRWVRTWMADYVSVEDIFWKVPGDPIPLDKLPSRAFDSPPQQQETAQLIADYNQVLQVTPELDARFTKLAAERVQYAPLRYYFILPAVRITDMWLRPRTEILPSNSRWWEFDDGAPGLVIMIIFGLLNILYAAGALFGLARGGFSATVNPLLTFAILRSLFLGTLENPEPRYTLECYPVLIVLAAALWSRAAKQSS